ncbi:dicarboxylate/amino acid:cation symporter [candidate division LCP-89 bacterium B3_LCP]|uniref:Dicarboxylate/amino acid:cation symporter n=1 Tax=candidate division LCP-89 bacterium B3_LCP TaxID=2012998 RepID=A0A532V0P6_UNCL8|nr:MAG: dicarboxylate/amino acid:cation symporter [candidate division LCP-89 bacterium B3_LCP]
MLKSLTKINLTTQIFIGMALGIAAGALFGEGILPLANPLADLFLRLLKMIIVPLIITSIISGVTGVGGAGSLGRMGIKTLAYYVTTSMLAILTGQLLVNIISPGVGAELGLQSQPQAVDASDQSLFGILLRMIPVNPIEAMAEGQILPIIFFCILFGIFMIQLEGKKREGLQNLFEAGFEVMMKLTGFVIALAPLGVFGLIARIVATTGFEPFKSLGIYFITVVAALIIHAVITLPLLLKLLGKLSATKYVKAMSPALMTAFSTSSSSATLPLTLECAENRAGISNRTTSFVMPLGATINMDGTALYECVAVIFIAQAYGIDLTMPQQAMVAITALLASIGAAGIPMAGLVMMSIVLKAVGLPLEGIGLILAVDRLLDMCRTTVNVWSDSCGTAIIGRSEGETEILQERSE